MGSEEDVRRCFSRAGAQGRTLRDDPLKAATPEFSESTAFARTLTDDRDVGARRALTLRAARRDAARARSGARAAGYTVSETRLADGGFEKRTRSAFGLFGEIVTRVAPPR